MNKHLALVVKILIGVTFFVPLVMFPSWFIFPFIVPKIVVFRTIVLLILGGYILLLSTSWQAYYPRRTPITLAIGLFLLSTTLSTFVGVDWYHSFWDNHERMLGLFTIIHYAIYYIVATSVIHEWNDWRWLFRTFLFAGGIVMIIGVIQRFQPELLLNQSGSRVAATLGNPIYVGGYGLFLFFAGLLLALTESVRGWRIYALCGGALGFLGIFLSGTRGSMLGWLAGMSVLGVLYFIHLKHHEKLRRVVSIGLICFVALLGVLFFFRKTTFVARIPALGPLLNTSLSYGTSSTRLMAWSIALEAWKERPVFGWGPNNFYYAFNKYYRPEFLEHGWGETWFDNAHNILVNTLAVQGIVGVVFYVGIFGVVIVTLVRRGKDGTLNPHIIQVTIAFFFAHLVQNVFVFENPTSYLYFFLMLAFVNSATRGTKDRVTSTSHPLSIGPAVLVAGIVFLLIYATNVNPARANMATLRVLQSLYRANDPIGHYERTLAIPSPHIDDIRNDFARTAALVAPSYVEQSQGELARRLLELALDEMKRNHDLHPMDIRGHLLRAQLDEQLAMMTQNPSYLIDGETILEEALVYSPRRQQVAYNLALEKLNLRKFDEAIALVKQTVDDDPRIAEGWWRLAIFYREAGRIEEARQTLREAYRQGIVFDDRARELIKGILPEGEIGTGI